MKQPPNQSANAYQANTANTSSSTNDSNKTLPLVMLQQIVENSLATKDENIGRYADKLAVAVATAL